MNIVIVGQGAIGLLWYHQLVKNTNNHVSLLCSARTAAIPAYTYFTSVNNQIQKYPLLLATNNDLNNAELVLICVKSYHLHSVLLPFIQHIKPCATIVFCHNGMSNLNHLSLLPQPCYVLLTTHGAKIIKPFHVQHTGFGHNDLGLVHGNIICERQCCVVETLKQALPSLLLSHNIKEKQWHKLAINCVINPLTAVHNINNGNILNGKYSDIIDELLKEIVYVAECEKVKLDFNDLKAQVLSVAKNTAENCSSMRSDILKQRRTEIDDINGYIVSLAKKAHISVPKNEKLVQQVKAIEAVH